MILPVGGYNTIIMADYSVYKGRRAVLSCGSGDFFNFISDMRNFNRFVKEDYVSDWDATSDTCRIRIPHVGEAYVRISEKEAFSLVRYTGKVLQNNEFIIDTEISENGDSKAEVDITVRAELNPVLKMMASGLIERFLDSLVEEMENFSDWKVA